MDESGCHSGPIQWALIPGAKRGLPGIEQERYLTATGEEEGRYGLVCPGSLVSRKTSWKVKSRPDEHRTSGLKAPHKRWDSVVLLAVIGPDASVLVSCLSRLSARQASCGFARSRFPLRRQYSRGLVRYGRNRPVAGGYAERTGVFLGMLGAIGIGGGLEGFGDSEFINRNQGDALSGLSWIEWTTAWKGKEPRITQYAI